MQSSLLNTRYFTEVDLLEAVLYRINNRFFFFFTSIPIRFWYVHMTWHTVSNGGMCTVFYKMVLVRTICFGRCDFRERFNLIFFSLGLCTLWRYDVIHFPSCPWLVKGILCLYIIRICEKGRGSFSREKGVIETVSCSARTHVSDTQQEIHVHCTTAVVGSRFDG